MSEEEDPPRAWTPLHFAAYNGRHEAVPHLLGRFHPNSLTPDGSTALFIACERDQIEVVRALLQDPRTDINIAKKCPSRGEWSCLYIALQNSSEALVELLIAQPSLNVNHTTQEGCTCLYRACSFGQDGCVAALLRRQDIDVNKTTQDGCSALLTAINYDHSEVVALMLADPRIKLNPSPQSGWSPVYRAASNGFIEILQQLLRHPDVDVNQTTKGGCSPLYGAVCNDHEDTVSALLDHPGIQVNITTKDGWSPLHYAVYFGKYPVVLRLLAHPDLDPNLQTSSGSNALIMAAEKSHPHILKVLLDDDRTEVNFRNSEGYSALYGGVLFNSEEAVKLLLNSPHIDPNLNTSDNYTPLLLAVFHNRAPLVRRLLSHPLCDPNKPGKGGTTPLVVATERLGSPEVLIVLLEDPRVDVNKHDQKSGYAPLHVGASTGNRAACMRLLQHPGVAVNLPSIGSGRTPLHVAVRQGHADIVRLLLHAGADINAPDQSGATPQQMASGEVMEVIEQWQLAPCAAPVVPHHPWMTQEEGTTPVVVAAAAPHCTAGGGLSQGVSKRETTLPLQEQRLAPDMFPEVLERGKGKSVYQYQRYKSIPEVWEFVEVMERTHQLKICVLTTIYQLRHSSVLQEWKAITDRRIPAWVQRLKSPPAGTALETLLQNDSQNVYEKLSSQPEGFHVQTFSPDAQKGNRSFQSSNGNSQDMSATHEKSQEKAPFEHAEQINQSIQKKPLADDDDEDGDEDGDEDDDADADADVSPSDNFVARVACLRAETEPMSKEMIHVQKHLERLHEFVIPDMRRAKQILDSMAGGGDSAPPAGFRELLTELETRGQSVNDPIWFDRRQSEGECSKSMEDCCDSEKSSNNYANHNARESYLAALESIQEWATGLFQSPFISAFGNTRRNKLNIIDMIEERADCNPELLPPDLMTKVRLVKQQLETEHVRIETTPDEHSELNEISNLSDKVRESKPAFDPLGLKPLKKSRSKAKPMKVKGPPNDGNSQAKISASSVAGETSQASPSASYSRVKDQGFKIIPVDWEFCELVSGMSKLSKKECEFWEAHAQKWHSLLSTISAAANEMLTMALSEQACCQRLVDASEEIARLEPFTRPHAYRTLIAPLRAKVDAAGEHFLTAREKEEEEDRQQAVRAAQVRRRRRRQRLGGKNTGPDSGGDAELSGPAMRPSHAGVHSARGELFRHLTDLLTTSALAAFPVQVLNSLQDWLPCEVEDLWLPKGSLEAFTDVCYNPQSQLYSASSFKHGRVTLKRFPLDSARNLAACCREAEVSRTVSHPNHLQVTAMFLQQEHQARDLSLFLVVPYPRLLPLDIWIEEAQPSEDDLLSIAYQVLSCLVQCHSHHIAHGNLSAEAILVDPSNHTPAALLTNFSPVCCQLSDNDLDIPTGIHSAKSRPTLSLSCPSRPNTPAASKLPCQRFEDDMYMFGQLLKTLMIKCGQWESSDNQDQSKGGTGNIEALDNVVKQEQAVNIGEEGTETDSVGTSVGVGKDDAIRVLIKVSRVEDLQVELVVSTLSMAMKVTEVVSLEDASGLLCGSGTGIVPPEGESGDPTRLQDLVARLCSCLPEARPSAADAFRHPSLQPYMQFRSPLQTKKECVIGALCEDTKNSQTVVSGVECSNSNGSPHFVCSKCLEAYVHSEASQDLQTRLQREGRVFCPLACSAHLHCSSQPFPDTTLAHHLTEPAFQTYLKGRLELAEHRRVVELEKEMTMRNELEIERLASMEVGDRTVMLARQHITENILNTRCPRCTAVFDDFDGCAALRCRSCPCAFCAWCLVDCGKDAHTHVRNCERKPTGADDYFPPVDVLKAAQLKERQRILGEYLQSLEEELRLRVIKAVEPYLKDSGLVAVP